MIPTVRTPSPVRSYVIRGRLTRGQREALRLHWQRFGIPFASQPLDLDEAFGRSAPRILDIGSGMGETTVALAAAHPENDYLAVEVHRPGVGSLLRHAVQARLPNLRVICHDIVEVLEHQIPQRSLDQVYIFFPDPWPKRRHWKRRLVNPRFLELLVPTLRSHARLWMATDAPGLARIMLDCCDAEPRLVNLAGPGNFAPRPAWRPRTRFEARGERDARQAWNLCYAPAGRISD